MKSSEASRLLLDCQFLSKGEYLLRLADALENNTLTHIVTLNAEMVVEAQHNEEFRNAVEHAELKIPDGGSMLWAKGYLQNISPPRMRGSSPASTAGRRGSTVGLITSLIQFFFSQEQPLTGVDSIFEICEIVEKINGSVYLLGGTKKQAEGTRDVLQTKYPRLAIQIIQEDFEHLPPQHPVFLPLTPGVSAASAIFVALGAPKQTLWIEANRKHLEQSGIKIAIGVGGAFAMISGELPRAPKLLRHFHLEWLWRLILEPKRIKRIWNAVVVFPYIVHKWKKNL